MWRKNCNNSLHQKQLDGKANNISCTRGGEGRGRKRKGEGLPSPPEGLILRPPPHLFDCYAA